MAVEQEKEKEKAKVENKIVVDTAKKPVEVLVYRDGKVEKLLMDKPLTVVSGKEGQTIILGTPGGKFEVVEGKPGRLEIKEGQVLQLGEGETFTLDKDGGKIVITKKSIGEKGEWKEPLVVSGVKVDVKDPKVNVVVRTGEKGEASTVWKVVEPSKGSVAYTIEGKDGKATSWTVAKPGEGGVAYTFEGKDGKALTWTSANKVGGNVRYYAGQDGKILDQIKQLREQAAAIKAGKLDIAELEKSLEKLETELKEEKGLTGAWKVQSFAGAKPFTTEGGAYYVDRSGKGDQAATVNFFRSGKTDAIGNRAWISDSKEGSIMLVLTGKSGSEGKADFVRALEKLKKDVPEGFQITEAKFDEESGAVTFKIQGPEGKKTDLDFLKKITESLKSEIKK